MTLLVEWASGWSLVMLSVMVGSMHPMYSPLLNLMCLFVWFNTKMLTDVFSFYVKNAINDVNVGSLPFVESSSVIK